MAHSDSLQDTDSQQTTTAAWPYLFKTADEQTSSFRCVDNRLLALNVQWLAQLRLYTVKIKLYNCWCIGYCSLQTCFTILVGPIAHIYVLIVFWKLFETFLSPSLLLFIGRVRDTNVRDNECNKANIIHIKSGHQPVSWLQVCNYSLLSMLAWHDCVAVYQNRRKPWPWGFLRTIF